MNEAGVMEDGDGGAGGEVVWLAGRDDCSLEVKKEATDSGENESVCDGRERGGSPGTKFGACISLLAGSGLLLLYARAASDEGDLITLFGDLSYVRIPSRGSANDFFRFWMGSAETRGGKEAEVVGDKGLGVEIVEFDGLVDTSW